MFLQVLAVRETLMSLYYFLWLCARARKASVHTTHDGLIIHFFFFESSDIDL